MKRILLVFGSLLASLNLGAEKPALLPDNEDLLPAGHVHVYNGSVTIGEFDGVIWIAEGETPTASPALRALFVFTSERPSSVSAQLTDARIEFRHDSLLVYSLSSVYMFSLRPAGEVPVLPGFTMARQFVNGTMLTVYGDGQSFADRQLRDAPRVVEEIMGATE